MKTHSRGAWTNSNQWSLYQSLLEEQVKALHERLEDDHVSIVVHKSVARKEGRESIEAMRSEILTRISVLENKASGISDRVS